MLGRAAPLVVLALDADRSGQEAMLRARAGAGGDMRAARGGDAGGTGPGRPDRRAWSGAFASVLDGRHADDPVSGAPGTCRCRPRHAQQAGTEHSRRRRGLIAEHTTEGSAMRDELVRDVADRLDVPANSRATARSRRGARTGPAAAAPSRPPGGRLGRRGRVPRGARVPGRAVWRAATSGAATFLRPTDEQLSSDATRRARDAPGRALRRPARRLARGRARRSAALVTDVALAAQERAAGHGGRAADEHPPAREAPHRARDPARRRRTATTRARASWPRPSSGCAASSTR